MAVLKQCFCYSLRQGSFIIGSYALIVYCIAFAVELWWIVESLLILPAPAYTLCALYFFNFIIAAVLLFGLLIKQRKYLMSWTLMTILSFFPEAGMVLFMSLYYWPAHKYEYGVMELVYWSLRAIFNIFGAVCVCSLYLTWRDEELILGRLHDLTLASVETGGGGVSVGGGGAYIVGGGTLKGSCNNNLSYQNYGYVGGSTAGTSPVLGEYKNYSYNNYTHNNRNNNHTFFSSLTLNQPAVSGGGGAYSFGHIGPDKSLSSNLKNNSWCICIQPSQIEAKSLDNCEKRKNILNPTIVISSASDSSIEESPKITMTTSTHEVINDLGGITTYTYCHKSDRISIVKNGPKNDPCYVPPGPKDLGIYEKSCPTCGFGNQKSAYYNTPSSEHKFAEDIHKNAAIARANAAAVARARSLGVYTEEVTLQGRMPDSTDYIVINANGGGGGFGSLVGEGGLRVGKAIVHWAQCCFKKGTKDAKNAKKEAPSGSGLRFDPNANDSSKSKRNFRIFRNQYGNRSCLTLNRDLDEQDAASAASNCNAAAASNFHQQYQHQSNAQLQQLNEEQESRRNLRASLMRMKSEFNPALLFDPAYRKSQISELGIAGIGLEPPGQPPSAGKMQRSRSLWNVSNEDYWNRPPPSRPVSLGYVNHAHLQDLQLQQQQSSYGHRSGTRTFDKSPRQQQNFQNNFQNFQNSLNNNFQNSQTLLRRGGSNNHLRLPISNLHQSNNNNNTGGSSNTISLSKSYMLLQNMQESQQGGQRSKHSYNNTGSIGVGTRDGISWMAGSGASGGGDGRRTCLSLAGRRAASMDGLNNNLFFQRYYGQNIMANHNQPQQQQLQQNPSNLQWSKSSVGQEDDDDIRSYQDIPL